MVSVLNLTHDNKDNGKHDETHQLDRLAAPLVDEEESGIVTRN